MSYYTTWRTFTWVILCFTFWFFIFIYLLINWFIYLLRVINVYIYLMSLTWYGVETCIGSIDFFCRIVDGSRSSWLQTLGNQLIDCSPYIRYTITINLTCCKILLEYVIEFRVIRLTLGNRNIKRSYVIHLVSIGKFRSKSAYKNGKGTFVVTVIHGIHTKDDAYMPIYHTPEIASFNRSHDTKSTMLAWLYICLHFVFLPWWWPEMPLASSKHALILVSSFPAFCFV